MGSNTAPGFSFHLALYQSSICVPVLWSTAKHWFLSDFQTLHWAFQPLTHQSGVKIGLCDGRRGRSIAVLDLTKHPTGLPTPKTGYTFTKIHIMSPANYMIVVAKLFLQWYERILAEKSDRFTFQTCEIYCYVLLWSIHDNLRDERAQTHLAHLSLWSSVTSVLWGHDVIMSENTFMYRQDDLLIIVSNKNILKYCLSIRSNFGNIIRRIRSTQI